MHRSHALMSTTELIHKPFWSMNLVVFCVNVSHRVDMDLICMYFDRTRNLHFGYLLVNCFEILVHCT